MRIAIVAPCILPVPATKGGAVEELITRIIECNGEQGKLNIDLFTVFDDSAGYDNYKNTEIISIKNTLSAKTADKLLDKYYRTVSGLSSKRTLDKEILQSIENRIAETGNSYDAVIVENMMSTAVMLVAIRNKKYSFPIYFHMHNDVDIYRSPEYIKVLVENGVQFIAVSKYIEKSIKKCAGDAVVHVLYNGVDLNKYNKVERATGDTVKFLYTGRVIPGKGVKELVIAFAKMLETNSNVKISCTLDIIGFSDNPTKYEREALKLAGRCGSSISCQKRLSTDAMALKYDEYDIVVFPTIDEEPFGMVALETMAKGKPLIVTNSGALPEVTDDGALVVEKGDNIIDNLADAMIKMATEKKYRGEIAAKAYRRAHSLPEFDINNYYDNLIDIISPEHKDEKISVVVPVYNVRDYLDVCVESLLDQTHKNLEIILVDDGSTDGSGELCDDYSHKDGRVNVIHQENMGLSAARNAGLELASGEYIFFCDSDDYLQNDALESINNKLHSDNADIVACGIEFVDDKGNISSDRSIDTDNKYGMWSGRQSVIEMMRSSNLCSTAWNKLYKLHLFDGIRFPVGALHEDEATIYKLLYKADIVSYTPTRYYKYRQRSESIMQGQLTRRSADFLQAIQDRIKFFEGISESELEEYSKITLLEWLKYAYRNTDDASEKRKLSDEYRCSISWSDAPSVMGIKKKIALLLWKYCKY